MSELSDLVEPFKRAVAVPGGFDALFPSVIESEIVGSIMDAVAAAQLDGFLSEHVVDPAAETVEPDLSNAEALNAAGALVMVYAHYNLLRTEVLNRKNHVRYQAGSAIFEEDQTASMLNELLRQAKARLDELRERAERGEMDNSGATVVDMAFVRAVTDYGSVGYHPLTAWGW